MSLLSLLAGCEVLFDDGPFDRDEPTDPPEQPGSPEAPTGATGEPLAELPAVDEGFEALVFYPGPYAFGFEPRVAQCDADGCPTGELDVPIDADVRQLVDADGRWFALVTGEFGEVDPVTGHFERVPYPADWDVSWEMSVAVDSATGEVLIGTLGGEGELLAFDPATAGWARRGTFDGDDIVAMAALSDGSLAALEMPWSGGAVSQLLRYDVDTVARLGSRSLSETLVSPDPEYAAVYASETWQLRQSGTEVFAVVRAEEPEVVWTATLDRATGEVTPAECP